MGNIKDYVDQSLGCRAGRQVVALTRLAALLDKDDLTGQQDAE